MITQTVPDSSEAAEYYFTYIRQVPDGDVRTILERQLTEALSLFATISEEQSLLRYAQGKWTLRETLAHVNDTERVFVCRALWFARELPHPLPSFDQEIAVPASGADARSWRSHVDEFRAVRAATLAFFGHLPEEAWMRRGTASGNPFTVHALAYITAGHVTHHLRILRERYLTS